MSIDSFLSEMMEALPFFYLFYLLFYAFSAVIGIAVYVLQGIAFMKIAQKVGVPNGWMAFIPIANLYLYGKIAEESDRRYDSEKTPKKWGVALLVTYAITMVVTIVLIPVSIFFTIFMAEEQATFAIALVVILLLAFIVLAASIVLLVLNYMVIYRIYRLMAGKNAPWMLVLSIFVSGASTVIACVLGFGNKFPLQENEMQAAPTYNEVP